MKIGPSVLEKKTESPRDVLQKKSAPAAIFCSTVRFFDKDAEGVLRESVRREEAELHQIFRENGEQDGLPT